MAVACPSRPPLPTSALVCTAQMLSPRSMMQLPMWSRGSHAGVQAAYPKVDLGRGKLHGQKLCITWKERCQQIIGEDSGIARLCGSKGHLSEEECQQLCERVRKVLLKEPNIVQVRTPVTIVGDIHGQFLDFLNILAIGGPAPETTYLFLGNYINRGYDSLSTICLAFLLKARFPHKVTLLRGSHETLRLTQVYNFYDECLTRYGHAGPAVWRTFGNCFDALPLAAVIDDSFLCIHSGLSPSIDTLDGIRALTRDGEVPDEGPILDLLWSDPDDRCGWGFLGRSTTYSFGEDITKTFLQHNGLELLVRSHQLVMDGSHWMHDKSLLSIWSAPNYCNRCRNQGALVEFDEHRQFNVNTFDAVPWPSHSTPIERA
eukprot:TRINITY_DN72106_c0_g1_i1.p1 TRINITY_DN72106_c0_g1~~TRINITY_DN72106_c0_g1_i1.p1  ORF type:complete len:373 (-),score=53.57 TRINITY_DN72106_c0_g1_i1:99-1217(-)